MDVDKNVEIIENRILRRDFQLLPKVEEIVPEIQLKIFHNIQEVIASFSTTLIQTMLPNLQHKAGLKE